jgi:ribosomal protein S6--L-glutamate ligase
MNIAILSRKPALYSTARLREAAEQRGHSVRVVDYLRCTMNITARNPHIMYQGKELKGVDAVVPRIAATYTFYGTAVVRQFEMMGVFTANEAQAISLTRDKLRCLQALSQEGIGLPVTGFAHSAKDIGALINLVGGAPLVIKLVEGTQGIGVILGETDQAARAVIEAFRQLDANILVQEFISEARGADIRCLVVDGRVVASMLRQGADGEFRSNLHRGGSAAGVELTPEERSTAERAAKRTGLRVAGVDILRSKRGPLLMEVNSSPGLRGIERASGVDVAGKIVEFLERNVVARKAKVPVGG